MNDAGESAQATSIESLATRAAGGDRDAFESLVEATHGVVYRVALRICGSRADAEDVVQETFIRALQGLATVKDVGATQGWLCAIARNFATDRVRSRGRRPMWSLDAPVEAGATTLLGDALASDDPGAEQALGSAQLGAALEQAIAELKEKHRVVLTLREIDGLTYEEIATALDISIGTVESRLHRAREALAKKVKKLARELD